MNKPNPIAAVVQPLQGRRLPSGWKPEITTRTYDQRQLEELWKNPQWSARKQAENIQQSARLNTPPTWDELFGRH